MYFTGYHGTSQEVGNKIVRDGFFVPSTGKKEWLGSDIYFYEKYSDSLSWAVERYHQDNAVLHVVISVEDDEYIDLDSIEGNKFYKRIINIIEKTPKEPNDFQISDAEENQCAVANYIWSNFEEKKILFASFPTKPSAIKLVKDYRTTRREFCLGIMI